MLAAAIVSCIDDDDDAKPEKKPTNTFTFDGVTKAIETTYYSDVTQADGGGYSFWLYPSAGDDLWEGIWIDIPKERMGTKFELTAEKPYHWRWWIEYTAVGGKKTYEGYGDPDEMGDVESGTMSIINKGKDSFAIEVDITFVDGKTLKIDYLGEMRVWD